MTADDETFVVLNDDVLPAHQAAVPIDDRGFLYGESVFTTLRCYHGVPFKLDRHVVRLNESLRWGDMGYQVDLAALDRQVRDLIDRNRCPDAVARFRVTAGRGVGPVRTQPTSATTLLTVTPCTVPPRPVRLIVSSVRRDPAGELGKHKLGSYMPSLLARREAHDRNADEAIIRDTDGNLLECACSNLFAVIDGVVVTPGVTENLLPGIARETVLQCAEKLNIDASPATLTPQRLAQADEWFITNSLVEIAPVAQLDDACYDTPGPVTARLIDAYHQYVAEATR